MQEELFDPQKSYKWEENQNVVISGSLFGLVLNLLTAEVTKPETQIALRKAEALQQMQNVVRTEVNAGRFREVPQEGPQTESVEVQPDVITDIEFEEQQG